MEIEIQVTKKVEVVTLKVKVRVPDWADAQVSGVIDTEGDLIPCRIGDYWCPSIDIDSGIILNWKAVTAVICYKVCDNGTYSLLDSEFNTVVGNFGYRPSVLSIDGRVNRDYINMIVEKNGQIQQWNNSDLKDFYEQSL